MNDKTKIAIGVSCGVLALGAVGFFGLSMLKQPQKQEVATVKVSKIGKKKDQEETSSKVKKVEKEPEQIDISIEEPVDEQSEIKINENDKSIRANLDGIVEQIKNLHDFSDGSTFHYQNFVNVMNQYNVTVDEATVKGPFGQFEPLTDADKQTVVRAGVSFGYVLEQSGDDPDVRIRLDVSTGQSAIIPEEGIRKTGYKVAEALKTEEYAHLAKEVEYQLLISKDGMSATLTRLSPDWW